MMKRVADLIAFVATFAPFQAAALELGSTTRPPVAISAAAPLRQALIVAPGPGGGTSAADADAYDATLRLLGYSVTTLVVETRPELDGGLRRFAIGVKPGGEVAVLLLGGLHAVGRNLYLMPTAASPDIAKHPEILATEGVTVTEALTRIEAQGPKELVAVVDTCRPAAETGDCRQAAASLPEGVSALIAERRRGEDASIPLARLASLRPELLPLMQRPNLTFFALYSVLKEKLAGTDMTLTATPSLSRSFAYLPADFLAKLRTECNKADPVNDTTTLMATRLEGIAASCADMARSYGFSPYFVERLAIVREQIAFQKTMSAGCDAWVSASFLHDHPNGRLHDAVERSRADCDKTQREAEEREAARKASLATCKVGGLDPAGNNWLALRERPSYQSAWSTTRMGPGTVVSRLGSLGEWSHIRLSSGETGWANGQFLTCGAAAEPAVGGEETPTAASGCFVTGLDPNGDNWLALRNSPNGKAPWSDRHMGPGTPLAILGQFRPLATRSALFRGDGMGLEPIRALQQVEGSFKMPVQQPVRAIVFGLLFLAGAAQAQTASEALIDLWSEADGRCASARGEANVQSACEERDRVSERLRKLHLCYSFKPLGGDADHWHPCEQAGHDAGSGPACVIADPTPTPLNVRTHPYGPVIGTIANGERVTILDEKPDRSGNTWSYVANAKPIGLGVSQVRGLQALKDRHRVIRRVCAAGSHCPDSRGR